jgi:hypothetical protein
MEDTTLLLLLGLITVLWWACVWGLFDAFVNLTKRPLFIYTLVLFVIVAFMYANPEIGDKLL